MKIYAALLSLLLVSGCASYRVGPSDFGQALDTATTAVAIYGTGAVESNVFMAGLVNEPVGMVAMGLVKEGLVVLSKSLKKEDCRLFSGGLFGAGLAAGINNLIVIAGVATPGAAAVAPAALLFWWLYDYFDLWQKDCVH